MAVGELKEIDFSERAVSSSALKEAKKSTRSFLWYYSKDKTTTSYFDYGNSLELYLIDKEEFYKKVAVMDESKRPVPDKDYRTKENKEWKDNFYKENADKYIISATGDESFESIEEIEKLVNMHPAADILFDSGNSYQETFNWTCPISGLKRSARPDLVNKAAKRIIDIKTYADKDFERACVNNDHFLQARDQIQGAVLSGEMDEVAEYYWMAISKSAPYHVDFYAYPIGEDLKVEEVHNSIMYRLRDDLTDDAYSKVYHRAPIDKIKIPNYYK